MALLSDFFLAADFDEVRSGTAPPAWQTANTNGLHIALVGEALTGRPWNSFLLEMEEQMLLHDDEDELLGRVPEALVDAFTRLTDAEIPYLTERLQTKEDWQGEHPVDVALFVRSLHSLSLRARQENLKLFFVTRL
jgi:hypothetical protein